MQQQILLKVEKPSVCPDGKRIKLYERIIDTDSSICIPYDTLVSSSRFLYGSDSIVTIELCNI